MGVSFRASLTPIRAPRTEIHLTKKLRTDRQTDGETAFQLYIVDSTEMALTKAISEMTVNGK